jgi:cell division protein FtsW
MNENVKKYFQGDGVIWGVIIALSLISLLAVYSATGTLAYKYQHGNTSYYVLKHLTYMFIGLVITFVTHHIPYQFYSRLSQIFLIICIPLLLVTLIFGRNLNDASRWLTLPGIGLTIQTSDFAKLALIMYLARLLSLKQEEIKDFKKAFVPLLMPVALVCILILPANFSTSAILFFTCLIIMFIGRVRFKQIMALVGIGVVLGGLYIGIALMTKNEGRINVWQNRIESFISGGSEENFQAEQAKIAIATGGIIGKGPGKSSQRNFLPHPYSDFIYAIIIEEYGLVGGLVIMLLYLWLLFRAGIIVRKSDRTFPAFLAIGLTTILVFQAMINMAVAVNLFPVTGQTLPLVSMGGSSQLFTCFSLGIILSVSRTGKKQKEPKEKKEKKETENKTEPSGEHEAA